jgi:CheY-like chemotaxis protein
VRIAASGHDCLDLLTSGYQPDVIFMDLAMPGIDGWETIRRLRALGNKSARIAIVSANAFDKGLDHDVDIPADDFILKPVRHSELLDWLERRLALVWITTDAPLALAASPAAAASASVAWNYPDRQSLDALHEVVYLGYYRGILNKLDEIEAGQPASAAFVCDMRVLARQFQFEVMSQHLGRAILSPRT